MEHRREMIVRDDAAIDAYVGVRSWRFFSDSAVVTLTSMFSMDNTWSPGEVKVAECQCGKRNRAPWRTRGGAHTCGIYAWRDVEATDPMPDVRWYLSPRFIHGEVYLWGDVRCHQRGYRASHALPACFYISEAMPPQSRLQVRMAADQYGVPLVQRDIINLGGRMSW